MGERLGNLVDGKGEVSFVHGLPDGRILTGSTHEFGEELAYYVTASGSEKNIHMSF